MTQVIQTQFSRLGDLFQRTIAALFETDQKPMATWVRRTWMAGLYLFGAVTWGFFLNWGRLAFDLHDWTQEGPRYYFIRQALLQGQLPLSIGSELASTENFLAIPDTIISPQILLLRYVEPGAFVLINSLFLYTLGFVGLLLLMRKFKWSAVTFSFVFMLFSLNGHPIAQVAVGHSMWISYFLLPYFVLLVFEMIEGEVGWKWVTYMALLVLGINLNGGFHFVNWILLFLLLLGLTSRRYLAPALMAILYSVLVSLPRILPAAMEFGGEGRSFISGYFSIADMVSAFVTLKLPEQALSGMNTALGWWEVDTYTGALGFIYLLVFGVYFTLQNSEKEPADHRRLMGAMLAMAVLSLGKMYQPFTMLPIPLADTERVSSRFIIVPVVILIVLAGTALERFLRSRKWELGTRLAALLILGITAHDLLQHARLWRVENMGTLFSSTPVDIRAEVITQTDPVYLGALLIGLAISACTLLFLRLMSRREQRADLEQPG
jgi:hypothetical protein